MKLKTYGFLGLAVGCALALPGSLTAQATAATGASAQRVMQSSGPVSTIAPIPKTGETAPLWPGAAPGAQGTGSDDIPTLTTYLPASNPTHTAIVIAPGGGYLHLSTTKEGEDVAHWLNANGIAAFVLRYRLGPRYHDPIEIGDAKRAMRTVRSEAEKDGFAVDRIGLIGFSAGGHLAATAGTQFDAGQPDAADPIERASSRPDFLILCYPVISMEEDITHKGSLHGLLGDHPTQADMDRLSANRNVTPETPPTFLYATTDDATVPVQNSVLFYTALHTAKVPVEMHLYEHGPHGSGLAQGFPALKSWPEWLLSWLGTRGLVVLPGVPPPPAPPAKPRSVAPAPAVKP
jgi:acetyl esterase/lipase